MNIQRRTVAIFATLALTLTTNPLTGLTPQTQLATSTGAASSAEQFDLSVPSWMFLREKTLRDVTIAQSFAFDTNNRWIFVVQLMQSGRQLPGEPAPVPYAERAADGDLAVSRLDFNGNVTAWMYLRGFGHGVAIGVEPVGRDSWLWVETDAEPAIDGKGYGTRIARLKFAASTTLTYPDPALEVHTPVPGSTVNTVSLDPLHRTLLVRHLLDGAYRYNLYDLDAFRGRDYTPQATAVETGIVEVFQGHAHMGGYVYRLEGTVAGPTFVSCFDLAAGAVVQRSQTKAASTLTYREPEGLAIQYGSPRLHMGFVDGVNGARNLSLYYKGLYGQ